MAEPQFLCSCPNPQPCIIRTCGPNSKPENVDRQFWCCAIDTNAGGCKFFKWDVPQASDKTWTSRKRPAPTSAPATDELAQTVSSLLAKVDSQTEILLGITELLKNLTQNQNHKHGHKH